MDNKEIALYDHNRSLTLRLYKWNQMDANICELLVGLII